ncbi:TetR family transcriptional regulator [Ureibacillus composti]|nr:TetR family transcriptional regulator [Ureibacillus composti]
MPKLSQEHKEQRKQQILMASLEVFKRKGYEKATLKDIVEEAGMSRGWIYLYFKDKIEIFEALILYLDQQMDDSILNQPNQPSIAKILRDFLESYYNVFPTIEDSIYPAIYEFWISGWREPRAKAIFMNRYETILQFLSNLIKEGIEQREFQPTLPAEDIAKMIMSTMDGILIHSLAFGSQTIDANHQVNLLIQRMEMLLNLSQDK